MPISGVLAACVQSATLSDDQGIQIRALQVISPSKSQPLAIAKLRLSNHIDDKICLIEDFKLNEYSPLVKIAPSNLPPETATNLPFPIKSRNVISVGPEEFVDFERVFNPLTTRDGSVRQYKVSISFFDCTTEAEGTAESVFYY